MARNARSEDGGLWWVAAIVAVTVLGVVVALHAPAPAPPVATGAVGPRAPAMNSRPAPPRVAPTVGEAAAVASGETADDGGPLDGEPLAGDPVGALRAALADARAADHTYADDDRRALRTRIARSYRAALPRLTEAERHSFFAELSAATGELAKPEPTPDL